MNINKLVMGGNVSSDVDLKSIPNSGTPVCNFMMAVNRKFKTAEGEKKEEVNFFRVVVWNKLAELASQFLKKGSPVVVLGRLQNREFEKDGVKRYTTEIIAEDLQFVPNRATKEQEEGSDIDL